jgi:hypothetical protein
VPIHAVRPVGALRKYVALTTADTGVVPKGARKYGILGRLALCGGRLRRGLDGTVGIRVTS